MKVRFLTSVSTIGGSYGVDTVVEVDAAQGKQWLKAGWCEESKDAPTAQVAVVTMTKDDEDAVKAAAKAEATKGRRTTAKAQADAVKAAKAAK